VLLGSGPERMATRVGGQHRRQALQAVAGGHAHAYLAAQLRRRAAHCLLCLPEPGEGVACLVGIALAGIGETEAARGPTQ